MIRRSFLKAIGSALLGLTLARTLPGIGGEPPTLPQPISQEVRVGDLLTFEGKYAFNPVTRQETDHLQYFVVTDIRGDTIKIHPQEHGQPDSTWKVTA